MLAHNGQIIALGKVNHDERSLSGKGTPQEPLGVQNYELLTDQQWVKNYVSAVAGDTIPYSGSDSVKVDEHKISVKDAWLANQLQSYTYNKQTIDNKDTEVRNQFSAYIPRTASAGWDVTPYVGTGGIKIANHVISISADVALKTDITAALADYYTASEVDDLLANFGGFETADGTGADNHPDVANPKTNIIYLVLATSGLDDNYKEWIYKNGWVCIGDTSVDLTNYVKRTELSAYAKKTDISDMATQTWVNEQGFLTEIPEGYATEEYVQTELAKTSAWADEKFVTSADVETALAEYAKTKTVWTEFSSTSAWANRTFATKTELEDYVTSDALDAALEPFKTASGDWNTAYNLVQTYSGDWNEVSAKLDKEEFNEYSAGIKQWIDQTEEWDVQKYEGTDGIEVNEHTIRISADFVSASQLDNYYTRAETSGKNQLSAEFDKYQPSGNYVEFEDMDELLKPYAFTSAVSGFKNTLVKSSNGTVEISAYMENGVQVYDLSATQGGDYTQIVGENGVSAEKNEDTGEWHVGMNWDQNLISYGKFYTSPAQEYASSAAFAGYTMVDHISGDPDENDIDLDNDKIVIKKHGLYHVDVLVSVNIDANDTSLNYFTVTLKSGPNETLHQIDASYPHTEYINFSYDINTPTDDYILENTIKDLPVGAEFKIENMNVHRVLYSTGDMYGQGGATYIGGDGITIDQDTINVNIGKGLELNNQTEKKLQVKLGKGLTYGTGDEIDAIVLDDPTEEVVKTVTDLKEELDNKLTTNMNISDAKKIGSMFKNTTYGTMGCSLFTVPLQHKLTFDTQVSFFTTQGLNQQASFPIVIGILEYNFDYWDNDRKQYRSQTNWIADTGPIFNNTPDVNGNTLGAGANKYTFKLNHVTPVVSADYMYGGKKYHNEYGPVLRSDRAYYLAVFAKHPDGLGYVLGDEGYDSPTNSDPYISYYCNNMVYNDGDPSTSGTMDNNWTHWDMDLSISAMNYWNRGGEAKEIVRPFVMIRNPMA
jgi:hypothetical protein